MKMEPIDVDIVTTPAPPNVKRVIPRRFRFVSRRRLLIVTLCVIGALGFYMLGRAKVFQEHPEFKAQAEASAILAKVSQLIQLPEGETPSLATITDAENVKKAQPFLNKAVNEDILIIYPAAAVALLYRPSTNKLIAVGPVTNAPEGETPSSPPPKNATTSSN